MKPLRRDLGTALVGALAFAASPRPANGANDTVVRLDYRADEQAECIGEDQLRRVVTDQLGHDPFRPDADRQVAISITKTEAGFQGRIVWTETDGRQVGQRLLVSRSRDCREISANVAFAVGVQLQLIELGKSTDEASAAQSEERSPPDATNPASSRPTISERPAPSPQPPVVPARASPHPLVLAVGAGPAVSMRMTPEATALGRLFVVARRGLVSGEVAADAALPATQREPNGRGVVVNALGTSAAGCAHVSVAAACALGRLGWIRAQGTGVGAPSTSWAHFEEIGMRLAGTKDFGRFIVSVHADGLVMLARWDVVLNDTVVWTVPRVGGAVGIDVALRFF